MLHRAVGGMAGLRWGALLLAVGAVRGEDGGAVTSCEDVSAELDGAKMQPVEGDDARDESWTTWTDELVGDTCEGTAVGETCGDFACQRGYEGGQLMCGEGGVWVVDACSAIKPPEPAQPTLAPGGQPIAGDTPETCHVSDDLTCVGFALAVCALAAAVAAMVLLPKIMHTSSTFTEGRSLYSDEGAGDDLDLLESLEDQNVDEYGDQDEHAAKKRLRESKRGNFQAVAESDEVIEEP